MLNIYWVKLKDFRQIIPMIAGMTALALVLIAVFGMSFRGADKPDIYLVDLDGTDISRMFLVSLESVEGFDYVYGSYDVGKEAVIKGDSLAMVVIEKDFGRDISVGTAKVTLLKAKDSLEQFTLQSNLSSVGRNLALEEAFLDQVPSVLREAGLQSETSELREELRDQVAKYPIMSVSATTYDGLKTVGYDSLRHSFIGFILFFSMFTMVFGIGSIVEEKENNVWQRQSVAPVSMAQIMAGNLLATFTVGMAQLIILVIISRVIFGIDWGGSLLGLLLVLAAYVIATTSVGLFMAGLVSTSQQLGSFSPIVVVSTSMIGGCMWPLEIISSRILLFLADLTPQRWAYKGLKAVIINNGGIADVFDAVLLLLIIAVLFFILGLMPYVISRRIERPTM